MAHTSTLSKFIDRHAYKLAMGMTALGVALLSSALTSALVGDRGLVLAIGDQLAGLQFWADAPARIDAAPKVAGMPRYLNRELLRETTGTYLGLEFDRLPWAASIRSGGAQFKRGIAMHAPPTGTATATFSIPSGASHFVALVGLADGAEGGAACVTPGGSVRFAIQTDGLPIIDPIEASGSPGATHRLRIALPAFARSLTLAVDNLDGSNRCDSAVWLEARFDALGKFPTEVAALRDPPAPVVAEPTQAAEEMTAIAAVAAEKKPMPQPVIELVDAILRKRVAKVLAD